MISIDTAPRPEIYTISQRRLVPRHEVAGLLAEGWRIVRADEQRHYGAEPWCLMERGGEPGADCG